MDNLTLSTNMLQCARIGIFLLLAGPGAHTIQGRHRFLHGSAPRYQRWWAFALLVACSFFMQINFSLSLSRVADVPGRQLPPIVWSRRRSDSQHCRQPLPPFGTHSRKTSSVHQLFSHFNITWKPFWSGAHSRTLFCSQHSLVVLSLITIT